MKMKQVVINTCFGGFGLSDEAKKKIGLAIDCSEFSFGKDRDNPKLVEVVLELCEDSWGEYAELKIVEIPEDVDFVIFEYDGVETIHEKHRIWS